MTLSFLLILSVCLREKTQVIAHAPVDVKQGEHSSIADGSANLYNYLQINMTFSQKTGNQFNFHFQEVPFINCRS